MTIAIKTSDKRQIIDVTEQVEQALAGMGNGLANVFVGHTTAAVTTADLDPGTDEDILEAIRAMTPDKRWRHPHDPGHFPDHLWSTLLGPGVSIPFKNGKLQLGTWQRLILVELDGPRDRQVELTVVGSD